jgi:alanyl-tRNA synthetase
MTAAELRNKYIEFFKTKGHAQIQGKSLLPDNDPTVLFTTAGMHPLVPYLLGEEHPAGQRLVNYQKCIRTGDIDAVGDSSHLTFFEMLGNWSLGDYFKEGAIRMSYEFLTSPQWLGIPVEKIGITVFKGDEDAPRDEESADVWRSLGIPESRIRYLGKADNWWGPPAPPAPAVRIRRCSTTSARSLAVRTAARVVPAESGWKSGTMSLCSTTRIPKGVMSPFPAKTLIRAWESKEP